MRPGNPRESLRQAMSWLHTWSGLLLGWVLFAIFLTGTLAFFRPEITRWMTPESRPGVADTADALSRAQAFLQAREPGSPRWFIYLPTDREPSLRVSWQVARPSPGQRRFDSAALDPATGREIAARHTRGGDFFYRFHYELGLPYPWGRWLAGIAAMFMLVAIISGVITHKKIFTDFFTLRVRKSSQRAWMDGHNVLSVLGLPFHAMITFSGLLLLMVMLLPAGVGAAYGQARGFTDEMYPAFRLPPAAGSPAPLAPLAAIAADAQRHWQGGRAGRVVVSHPGDAHAEVAVLRDMDGLIAYGRSVPVRVYDGVSTRLKQETGASGAATATAGAIVGLHLGLYARPWLRWIYFLFGLAGTAMVGSGLMLWLARRRPTHAAGAPLALRLVDTLNVAAMAGLCLATAAYFWANRLLPIGLAGRADWEIRAFYAAWVLALVHAALRGRQAWPVQLAAGAALFAALPFLNAWSGDRHLWRSLGEGDWVMAGFDLFAAVAGLLMAWLAAGAAQAARRARRGGAGPVPRPAARKGGSCHGPAGVPGRVAGPRAPRP